MTIGNAHGKETTTKCIAMLARIFDVAPRETIETITMNDTAELMSVKNCIQKLETALKGVDRDLVHFLNQEGFLTGDVHDEILKPVSMLTEVQKAGELVSFIKNRVGQDAKSYHTLVAWLKEHRHYQPIVKVLEDEYRKHQQTHLSQDRKF